MNYGKKGAADKNKKVNSKSSKVRKKFGVIFFKTLLIIILLLTIICVCAGAGVVKGLIDSAPEITSEDVSPSGLATTVYANDGTEITKLVSSGSNREYKTIDKIPINLQNALVAIEDERFYEHNGIDLRGILRAVVTGITKFHFSEGASTITQQLIKNNVFSDFTEESSFYDKMQRKIQEQYLAVKLEETMDKSTILEYYLNTINLGQNCLGVQTASERYFGKDVSELTLSECAVLAAITQNPSYYNPVTYPEHNKERRLKVLDNMLEQGYINQNDYDKAIDDDVYSRINIVNNEIDSSSVYTYFVDALIEKVVTALEEEKGYSETQAYNAVYKAGLSIYTTQDLDIQQICDEEMLNESNYPYGTEVSLTYRLSVQQNDDSVINFDENDLLAHFQQTDVNYDLIYNNEEDALAAIEQYKADTLESTDIIPENGETYSLVPQPQASVVIMDQYTGEVKAIVGGRGEKQGSLTLNRATDTTRQPGSTFKVLSTYAPAIDTAGMTLSTVFDDAPYNYATGRPVNNYYSGYHGLSTIRTAIQDSMNIVAVKALTDITPQLGYDYLLNFGFTTLVDSETLADGSVVSDIGQPLSLGGITNGITNLEITSAYSSIANGGTYIEPSFFTKILDAEGNVLIDNTPDESTVLKESTSFLLTNAMEDVITQGTGTTANFDSMPIAGKTGTTSDNVDVWLCAYTPYYTCSVWGGYDNNQSLEDTTYHMVIWRQIMSRIHENLEYKDFTQPDGIETATICKKSGKLAVPGLCQYDPRGDMTITEYFETGTAPTDYCDVHTSATICTESGKLAGEFCPDDTKKTSVYIITPDDSTGTTDDSDYQMPSGLYHSVCDVHTASSQSDKKDKKKKKKDKNKNNTDETNSEDSSSSSDSPNSDADNSSEDDEQPEDDEPD